MRNTLLKSSYSNPGLQTAPLLKAGGHRLIANTDMHLGNLSFHVEHSLRLAPAYDMLPMAYAPLAGGEVPPRDFAPALPTPPQRSVWLTACAIAIEFWAEAAADSRISDPFRGICRANATRLRDLADKV